MEPEKLDAVIKTGHRLKSFMKFIMTGLETIQADSDDSPEFVENLEKAKEAGMKLYLHIERQTLKHETERDKILTS